MHSYGADTAANVVAAGCYVTTLVTVDPVGLIKPNFTSVSANAGTWIDINATGDQNSFANAIAGLGTAYNNGPAGYANYYYNIGLDHAGISGLLDPRLPFHLNYHIGGG